MFTIENWGNLQLLIDFRWLKFAKCHMTHPTVQRHGDFQSQMAIAVQLKQKRKKKRCSNRNGAWCKCCCFIFTMSAVEA